MYKTGIIYKIYFNEIVYIGSTIKTLKERWWDHKSRHKKNNCGIAIYKYFDLYGIENFNIEVIKEYKVVDSKHLESKEQLYINTNKNCVNIISAFGIKYLRDKQYYEKNRVEINEKNKQYYEKNKDKAKQYYIDNKDKIKQYQLDNKDEIEEKRNVKIECRICNCYILKRCLNRHNKTIKHISNQLKKIEI